MAADQPVPRPSSVMSTMANDNERQRREMSKEREEREEREEQERQEAIKAAMMEELGIARLDALPMNDGNERGRGMRPMGNVAQQGIENYMSTVRNNASIQNDESARWKNAVEDGAFQDEDAQAVRGLDSLGGGRLHDMRARPAPQPRSTREDSLVAAKFLQRLFEKRGGTRAGGGRGQGGRAGTGSGGRGEHQRIASPGTFRPQNDGPTSMRGPSHNARGATFQTAQSARGTMRTGREGTRAARGGAGQANRLVRQETHRTVPTTVGGPVAAQAHRRFEHETPLAARLLTDVNFKCVVEVVAQGKARTPATLCLTYYPGKDNGTLYVFINDEPEIAWPLSEMGNPIFSGQELMPERKADAGGVDRPFTLVFPSDSVLSAFMENFRSVRKAVSDQNPAEMPAVSTTAQKPAEKSTVDSELSEAQSIVDHATTGQSRGRQEPRPTTATYPVVASPLVLGQENNPDTSAAAAILPVREPIQGIRKIEAAHIDNGQNMFDNPLLPAALLLTSWEVAHQEPGVSFAENVHVIAKTFLRAFSHNYTGLSDEDKRNSEKEIMSYLIDSQKKLAALALKNGFKTIGDDDDASSGDAGDEEPPLDFANACRAGAPHETDDLLDLKDTRIRYSNDEMMSLAHCAVTPPGFMFERLRELKLNAESKGVSMPVHGSRPSKVWGTVLESSQSAPSKPIVDTMTAEAAEAPLLGESNGHREPSPIPGAGHTQLDPRTQSSEATSSSRHTTLWIREETYLDLQGLDDSVWAFPEKVLHQPKHFTGWAGHNAGNTKQPATFDDYTVQSGVDPIIAAADNSQGASTHSGTETVPAPQPQGGLRASRWATTNEKEGPQPAGSTPESGSTGRSGLGNSRHNLENRRLEAEGKFIHPNH